MMNCKNDNKLRLGFGGACLSGEGGGYGFGEMPEAKAFELLDLAFSSGITLYDSAPIYGFGRSEELLGKAFKSRREKVSLISKCGITWHSNRRVDRTNRPAVAKKMLEDSLRRMQSDYIDIYMIHWPDPNVDIRRTMEVLADAKRRGKIKQIGLCNTTFEEFSLASEIEKVEYLQSEFNLFNHEAVETLFPLVHAHKAKFMGWGTFDKGILAGSVSEERQFEKSDARSWAPWWKKGPWRQKVKAVEKVRPLWEKHQTTPLAWALAHNLCYPEVEWCLIGAKSIEQWKEIFSALENLPSKQVIDELNAELEKHYHG